MLLISGIAYIGIGTLADTRKSVIKMASHWEEFYKTHLPPTDFEDNRSLLKEFCERHNSTGERIALVTVSLITLLM